MKLRFTNHAQAAILERGILASRVADTLRRPDSRAKVSGGKTACMKNFEQGVLKVIFVISRGEYVIMTAYYL